MEYASATVKVSIEDVVVFSSFIRKGGKRQWRLTLVLILWIGIIAAPAYLWPRRESFAASLFESPMAWIGFTVMGFLALLLFFGYRQLRSQAFWEERNPSLFLPSLFQVLDEGFYVENERSQLLTHWEAISRIAESPTHIYVMETRIRGHILPKRCFPSPEAAANFAEQARIRVQNRAAASSVPRIATSQA